MNEIEPTDGPVTSYAFDPTNLEECLTPIGEIVTFINAERAAQGLPRAASIIVVGSEKPYTSFDD